MAACADVETHRPAKPKEDLLTHVSPVAWQHINLCGRYEFTKAPQVINMVAIIQALAQAPVLQDHAL
jgi:hypothetical protein